MQTIKIYKYDDCTPEEWKEFVALLDSDQAITIDESMFYYWLEVLPPVYMNKEQDININGAILKKNCSFGFAEGREYIVDFWGGNEGIYFCKRSNRLNRGY